MRRKKKSRQVVKEWVIRGKTKEDERWKRIIRKIGLGMKRR